MRALLPASALASMETARSLALASRSGTLARDTAVEWEAVQATGVAKALEQCDTGEATHVRRLIASAPAVAGVWHLSLRPLSAVAGRALFFAPLRPPPDGNCAPPD